MIATDIDEPAQVVTAQRYSETVEDASLQAAVQSWIDIKCYQMESGSKVAQVDTLDYGPQQVVRERQIVSIQKLGVTPADLCTISCCTPDPSFRFSELSADDDTIFFMPEHTEFDIYVPAGAKTVYLTFSQEEFLRGARVLNPEEWESTPQHLLAIPAKQQAALNTTVDVWLQTAGAAATSGEAPAPEVMRQHLLDNILHITTASSNKEWRVSTAERVRAFHTYQMARAYIEESLAAEVIPSIIDICNLTGVSERTLQYAFRAYVNLSPLVYLRLCRFNRVRSILRSSDPKDTTVTMVAMQYGFLHLGRFSVGYKQLFHESPSETLAS